MKFESILLAKLVLLLLIFFKGSQHGFKIPQSICKLTFPEHTFSVLEFQAVFLDSFPRFTTEGKCHPGEYTGACSQITILSI